ncbi:MAG: prolipoprotein diacylglyceryl transferase [Candidatus Liberibacter ctenarytainae]|uniref:Phosphatidylglycerol--prolipoprotein diacylglyceryl transferase n=1 Tax=Candidatus Liberibacter ctenarytainae TaxID=2020335 RepID=A0A937DGW0_9HYPH|nr:prolipoprotein diacylglyceryl transferase [Candidatus Liberibacter ctenarytainae]
MLTSILTYPQINPIAISVGSLSIRWYGLSYLLGILFSIWYIRRLFNTQSLWTEEQNLENIIYRKGDCQENCIFWVAMGVIIGGRLAYVLFYNLEIFLEYPMHILYVWEGGMSFHGGLIGAFVSLFLFSRFHKTSFWTFSDLIAASVPLGIFFGRIANFVNGELWGKVSWVPWAMIFPHGGNLPRHPSQLYEAILEGLVLFCIGQIMVFRGSLKRSGLVTSVFVCGYAFARIFVEFFREPDSQLGYLLNGWMTMGILLSIPMVIIGFWGIFRSMSLERKDIS